MMRVIVSAASSVCSVESTRWPVSAATSAVSIVSTSRISPTRMMSGSCRSALRRPLAYDGVSKPISRWLITPFWSVCRNSIGSSIVRMCTARSRLMRSTSAASVVLLPLPVAPVKTTSPRVSAESAATEAGRPSDSSEGSCDGIRRIARPIVPRWRKTEARQRPTDGTSQATSTSSSRASCSRCAGVRSFAASASRSAARSAPMSFARRSSPCRRMSGGCPARRWMSEAPTAAADARMASKVTA